VADDNSKKSGAKSPLSVKSKLRAVAMPFHPRGIIDLKYRPFILYSSLNEFYNSCICL
jgi:hypothetical protein